MSARMFDALSELSELMLSLEPEEAQLVYLRAIDDHVVLEGSVPSYEAKYRIESLAQSAGIPIKNCLRIVPGIHTYKVQPAATAAVTEASLRPWQAIPGRPT
jgi:hypothetical protein